MVRRLSSGQIVLATAAVATALKLWIAARTFGTNDVHYWTEFMDGVSVAGPLHVYGISFESAQYNHGPLTSWLLALLAEIHHWGVPVPFLVRAPAALADLVTAYLLFLVLRRRRTETTSLLAAVAFCWCPVSLIISGFHGNTDPLFVMLAMASLYLLTVRQWGLAAGACLGLAISVKIVPVVLVPVMLVVAWKLRPRIFASFIAGGALVATVLWLPVLATEPSAFVSHYLGYAGIPLRQWGVSQGLSWMGLPPDFVLAVGDRWRFPAVLLAALGPALLAWRAEISRAETLVGLPLCAFLVVSPAFSMQYLVWPVAFGLVVTGLRGAAPYMAAASVTLIVVYSGWNQALPWNWDEARATPVPNAVLPLVAVSFLTLVHLVVRAIRQPVSLPAIPTSEGTSYARR